MRTRKTNVDSCDQCVAEVVLGYVRAGMEGEIPDPVRVAFYAHASESSACGDRVWSVLLGAGQVDFEARWNGSLFLCALIDAVASVRDDKPLRNSLNHKVGWLLEALRALEAPKLFSKRQVYRWTQGMRPHQRLVDTLVVFLKSHDVVEVHIKKVVDSAPD